MPQGHSLAFPILLLMLLVLEYYFVGEKIEIMMSSERWFEKVKRNEEESPNKINKESWV